MSSDFFCTKSESDSLVVPLNIEREYQEDFVEVANKLSTKLNAIKEDCKK